MDTVFVSNFAVPCRIGLTDEERAAPQRVLIDLVCRTSFTDALETGSLECGVNYSALRKGIRALVEERTFVLLEELAHAVLTVAFGNPKVAVARVSVRKPDVWTDAVPGVIMTRRRK